MIVSFRDKLTAALWAGNRPKGFPADVAQSAIKTLAILNAATALSDLRTPPGNRMELLKGDRAGQHSIRINDHWRLCFIWSDGGAQEVEIADYH